MSARQVDTRDPGGGYGPGWRTPPAVWEEYGPGWLAGCQLPSRLARGNTAKYNPGCPNAVEEAPWERSRTADSQSGDSGKQSGAASRSSHCQRTPNSPSSVSLTSCLSETRSPSLRLDEYSSEFHLLITAFYPPLCRSHENVVVDT